MLIDARELPAGTTLDCDICIVGAGAAGLAMASELVGSGLQVVVLEAGGAKQEAASQAFYAGESLSPAHPDPSMYRQRRLGGSTTIWGGRCVPFDPIDFEPRAHVPLSGWPFGRETLDPYYTRAMALLDAGAHDFSARTAFASGAMIEGFDDPIVGTDLIERYSLPTDLWQKLKPMLVAAPDVRIVSNAACLGFATGENGSAVDHAPFATPEGLRSKVTARHYVIAGGGLETVRLLARSGPVSAGLGSAGLGNHSDFLGRTYMCHVELALGELQLAPAQRGVSWGFEKTIDGVYARRRFTIAPARQRELGILNAMIRLHHANVVDPVHRDGILSTMFLAKRFVIPEFRRKLSMVEHAAVGTLRQDARFWARHVGNVARGAPRLAGFLADWVVRRHVHSRRIPYVALPSPAGIYSLDVNVEQAPDRASRVTLGDAVDRFGIPQLKIDWRINDLDVASAVSTMREMKAALARSGCGTIAFDEDRVEEEARAAVPVGGHHIGTARMAVDPKAGVVDSDLRVHGVANLFVAGAAVFPTSSHANPTLTLVALAMRLADHLAIDRKAKQ